MTEVTLSVPAYDAAHGVVILPEGGDVLVQFTESGVEVTANPAGLRDLARWCLALADEQAPDGSHIHLDPGTMPLMASGASLLISRKDDLESD